MNYTISHIYDDYIDTEKFIDKSVFKDICESFNIEIMSSILEGETFNMRNKLSTLSVARRTRDPRAPKIDWGASIKYKKELQNNGVTLYNSLTEKDRNGIYILQILIIVNIFGIKENVEFQINRLIDFHLQED